MKHLILVLFSILVFSCNSQKRVLVKQGKIPNESVYVGGIDGGSWLYIANADSTVYLTFFDSYTGKKVITLNYLVKSNYTLKELKKCIINNISAFDNQKIIWQNNKLPACLYNDNK